MRWHLHDKDTIFKGCWDCSGKGALLCKPVDLSESIPGATHACKLVIKKKGIVWDYLEFKIILKLCKSEVSKIPFCVLRLIVKNKSSVISGDTFF